MKYLLLVMLVMFGCADNGNEPQPENNIPQGEIEEGAIISTTANEYHNRWSPDGSTIAYTRRTSDNTQIWLWSVANKTTTPLVTESIGDQHLSWNGGGTRILFDARDNSSRLQLWIKNIQDGSLIQLTNSFNGGGHPDWCKTNNHIVYVSSNQLNIISEQGDRIATLQTTGEVMHPAWSQDGTMICYTSNSEGNENIYLVNSDGTNLRQITSNSALDDWARFSPDDSFLVFVSIRSGNRNIWKYNFNTDTFSQLTFGNVVDNQPDVSPDLRYLVFARLTNGNYDVLIKQINEN